MGAKESLYAHRPLDFVQKVESLQSYDEICAVISEELAWFGFTCVTSFIMPGPGEPFKKGVHLNTRPQDYIDRYEEKNYVVRDPVVTELRNTVPPFAWSDVIERRNLGRPDKRIIEEAQEFDVNSPCGRNPDLSPEARRAVELISLYSHEALKRTLLEKTPEQRGTHSADAAGERSHALDRRRQIRL